MKRNMSTLLLIGIAGLIILTGCENSPRNPMESQTNNPELQRGIADINNIVWTLASVEEDGNQVDISWYPPFRLLFDDTQFHGDDGCNWFNGPYEARNDSVYPGNIAQTLRLCIRASFSISHLTKPYRIEIDKNDLHIYAGSGAFHYRSAASDSVRNSELTSLKNFRLNESTDPEYPAIQSQLTIPTLIFDDDRTFKLTWYGSDNDSLFESNQLSGIFGLGEDGTVLFYQMEGSYTGPGSIAENFMQRILESSSYVIEKHEPKGAKLILFNENNGARFEFETFIRSWTSNSYSVSLNDTLQIAFGDTVFNDDENIRLTFDSLLGDSRCPVNVQCVWEGNAEIGFVFSKDSEVIPFRLNTSGNFATSARVGDYDIKLVDVFPVPHTDSLYVADDYSARVVVSKE